MTILLNYAGHLKPVEQFIEMYFNPILKVIDQQKKGHLEPAELAKYLTQEGETIVLSWILRFFQYFEMTHVQCSLSLLDYCNSLYLGISGSSLAHLQLVQNTAARLLTGSRKFDHITPILSSIHWLPVKIHN